MKPIRYPSSRILAISGLLLGILLPLLRAPHATAQATKANVGADQTADTSYLSEMPDPARVLADAHGSDSLDTAARQRASLEILSDVVESFARTEGSNLRLTPEEMELNRRYHGALNGIVSATYHTLDPNNQQQSVANSPRVKWNQLHDQYRESEAFIREVLDLYLSPSNRDRYLEILRQRTVEMASHRAVQAAQAAQEARQVAASAAQAAQNARQVTARPVASDDPFVSGRFLGGLVFIGIALLAVLWVRGFVRRTKHKTCECGAQVSSNAATCPKCGKNLLRSDETFECRNCKTVLFKDDHWSDERVVLAGSSTSFSAVEIAGSIHGTAIHSGPRSIRQLIQIPCPKCGEKYPFMGPLEKYVRVSIQLGFFLFIGVPLVTLSLFYWLYKIYTMDGLPYTRLLVPQPFWIAPIFSVFMFWFTIKFCRKIVKR